MARPTLFTHPKFQRLVYLLGLSRAQVIGHLELMWNVAYASGEPIIGDELDVELAAEWTGERGAFVRALTDPAVRLLDVTDDNRYAVHDLHDHAPEYVLSRRKREQERRQPKTCRRCGGTYRSSDPRSEYCSQSCRTGAWRDRQRRIVTESNATGYVHGTDRNGTPTPTPTPTPIGTSVTDVSVTSVPEGADLWQAWVEAAAAHGVPASLTCGPRDYQHVRTVLDLMSLADARRALAEFWRTPHFEAKRHVGMFAANAGQLLAHANSGRREPFGVKPPPTAADPPRPRLKTAAEIRAAQAAGLVEARR